MYTDFKLNEKLYISTRCRNAVDFSEPKLTWDGLTQVCWGLTSTYNVIIKKKKEILNVLLTKKDKDYSDCNQYKVLKPAYVMVCGVLVPTVGVTSVKPPLMLIGTYRFWNYICCYPEII